MLEMRWTNGAPLVPDYFTVPDIYAILLVLLYFILSVHFIQETRGTQAFVRACFHSLDRQKQAPLASSSLVPLAGCSSSLGGAQTINNSSFSGSSCFF